MQKSSMYLMVVGIVIILILFIIQSKNDKSLVMNPGGNQTAARAPAGGGGGAMDNESIAIRDRLKEIETLQMVLISAEAEMVENPKSFEALVSKGNCLFDFGQIYKQSNPETGLKSFEAAADAYHRALDLSPKNVDVMVDLGICYYETKRHDTAIDYFMKALDLNPSHRNAAFNIGVVELNRENTAAAIAAWENFVKVAPDDPRSENVKNNIAVMKTQLADQGK